MQRTLFFFPALLCACALGCSSSGPGGGDAGTDSSADTDVVSDSDTGTDSGDADTGGDAAGDGDSDGAVPPSNEALVFEVDPAVNPAPTKVELRWLDDAGDGTLTSADDGDGVQLIKAWTCIDDGGTLTSPGFEEQHVCTLRQVANNVENGSFIYNDWQDDAACRGDATDVHSEVNIYYHTQKIYELITAPEVGVFDRVPGRHSVLGAPAPLHVVANYQNPTPISAGSKLTPVHVAFFLPAEHLRKGMTFFAGLPGLTGDVLAFGQGTSADFGYSGETVYHEFGHFVFNAITDIGRIEADDQGHTNLPSALNEGLANTFAFLGSGQSMLHQYFGTCLGAPSWPAGNTTQFPTDLRGHPVADGMVVIAANWEIYRAMLDEWGGTPHDFIRVLLQTLQALPAGLGGDTFSAYATTFLATLESDGWDQDQVDAASSAFSSRGFLDEERVIDITEWDGDDPRAVYMYSASDDPWNAVLTLDQPDGEATASTAYTQWKVVVPAAATTVELSAVLHESYGAMNPPGDWDYRLFVRSGESIVYDVDQDPVQATYDRAVTPTIDGNLATWTIDGLAAGEVFLHLVNFGTSDGVLGQVACRTM